MSVHNDPSSPSGLERVSFEGREGEDVTVFMRSVKRVAIAEGRERDDQWLIDYTESCLAGPSFEWFLELDDNARESWRELQRAFLARFRPQTTLAPTPAAAPLSVSAALRPTGHVSSAPPVPSEVEPRADRYILLGDSGVGKSCLLARYLTQIWMPCTAPTAGVHYETRFRFAGEEQWEQHFWDLSGNQLYDDLTCKYYNNVHHLWLFYDVTDRKSFDNIRQWVARARQLCPRFSSARIIGNKSDLHDKRAVSIEQAKALAQELGITWAGEVSAKTNQGVQMTFGSWGPVSRKLCARP